MTKNDPLVRSARIAATLISEYNAKLGIMAPVVVEIDQFDSCDRWLRIDEAGDARKFDELRFRCGDNCSGWFDSSLMLSTSALQAMSWDMRTNFVEELKARIAKADQKDEEQIQAERLQAAAHAESKRIWDAIRSRLDNLNVTIINCDDEFSFRNPVPALSPPRKLAVAVHVPDGIYRGAWATPNQNRASDLVADVDKMIADIQEHIRKVEETEWSRQMGKLHDACHEASIAIRAEFDPSIPGFDFQYGDDDEDVATYWMKIILPDESDLDRYECSSVESVNEARDEILVLVRATINSIREKQAEANQRGMTKFAKLVGHIYRLDPGVTFTVDTRSIDNPGW